MFRCDGCGEVLSEFFKKYEPHGEEVLICSRCGSDDGAKRIADCIICGGQALSELLVCDECLKNTDMLIKFGDNDGGINYFLDSIFSDGEISEILADELKAALLSADEALAQHYMAKVDAFAQENRYDISEFLRANQIDGIY